MSPNGTVSTVTRRPRFASGAADKLPLSDGDWVLVRREITYGQERAMIGAVMRTEDGRVTPDYPAYDVERLVTWLLDWSFKDEDGDHIVLTRERIEALHLETAREINAALDTHLEGLEAKKAPSSTAAPAPGTSAPAATSASAVPLAGAGTS